MSDVLVPEAVGVGAESAAPQKLKNYAADTKVAQRLKSEVFPLIEQVRQQRKPLTEMWHKYLKVWTLEHESALYNGRSQVYVPAGKKGSETIVTQLVNATFPGEDNFSVEARMGGDPGRQQATSVKEVLKQRVEQAAKVRVHAERFYRQLGMTGNSPVKIHWRQKTIKGRDRKGEKKFVLHNAPCFESIDAANFYVWPEDSQDLQSAQLIFEDLTLPFSHLVQKAEQGVYVKAAVQAVGGEQRGEQKDRNEMVKFSAQGIGSSKDATGSGAQNGWGQVDVTEAYFDFDPGADTRAEERNPVPFLVTFSAKGEVLRAVENPFFHKMPPYLHGRMGTLTGRFYGTGWVEAIHQLNVLLNAQVNQAMDCGTYVLNPVVMANPNFLAGPLAEMEPGVQWLVNSLNEAVKFDRPPPDLIQYGSILATQTQSWINDFIGAPPVLQGGSSPGRAFRTATGIGTAQKNATVPLQEMVRLCEAEVWEPMLFMFYMLDQQFAEDEILVALSDGAYQRYNPEQLSGDWMFKWLASTQASNAQVKGQQITELLSVMAAPPMIQLMQMNGVQLNPVPLIRRLYQEVYGFRDVDEVVKIAAQTMMPQPGGAGAPNVGVSPDSLNGSTEDLGGNGEFGGMRTEANGIAGALGGLNAPMLDAGGEA